MFFIVVFIFLISIFVSYKIKMRQLDKKLDKEIKERSAPQKEENEFHDWDQEYYQQAIEVKQIKGEYK